MPSSRMIKSDQSFVVDIPASAWEQIEGEPKLILRNYLAYASWFKGEKKKSYILHILL